jgi:hypothetical protein
MHSVRVDRINKLVEQRLTGVPDVLEIEAAGTLMRQAVRSLNGGPGQHVSLIDCTELGPIADDAVASAFRQWNDPRFSCVRARKVAVVVPSALARLKLTQPVSGRPNMQMFADRAGAMRWLFA